MPPRLPTVERAMAAVTRRMRVRRVASRPQKFIMTSHFSPFISPVVKEFHMQLEASSSSASASSSSLLLLTSFMEKESPNESLDLSSILRKLLQVNQAAPLPPGLCVAREVNIKKETQSGIPKRNVEDFLSLYNPSLDPTIIKRVANAIDIENALQLARDLLQAIRKGGELSTILSEFGKLQTPSNMQNIELKAGISSRLYQGKDGVRHNRLRGFRLYNSDIQVAEILPNGKIVTFTDPTLPSMASSYCQGLLGLENPYLHFLLYKERLSLYDAFLLMSEACNGLCLPEDFATNIALEESAVTVQVCSVRIKFPDTKDNTNTKFETYREMIMKRLLQINLKPLQISIQILGWRSFSCNPSKGYKSQMQYSMLVRGITNSTTIGTNTQNYLEKRLLSKFSLFPNYFGPRYFGPLTPLCPFRSYHAAAAWERNMPAESLIIAATIAYNISNTNSEGWIKELVELLRQGEDRPAVLRQWYQLHIPLGLKRQISTSKSALFWNILASCRVHKVGENSLDSSPDLGDFVLDKNEHVGNDENIAKLELFPLNTLGTSIESIIHEKSYNTFNSHDNKRFHGILPILTMEIGTSYTLHDIVIPFGLQNNEVIEELSYLLGFRFPLCKLEDTSGVQVNFRSLFTKASGYPRTVYPWIKTLPEPSAISEEEEEKEGDRVYKLLTDMELRQNSSYTTSSRGQPQNPWPIGKYGHRLSDRLPVGALSLTSSDTTKEGSKSLALHFTLPGYAYSMALLREFILVEDYSTPFIISSSHEKHYRSKVNPDSNMKENNKVKELSILFDDESVDGNIMGKR
ncbi:uncharacterized protein TM35_000084200 [Trypanosoma theileri]|uniref:Uncharacterized protein n=1 Tax=Trypanosoma theileri TaxID=67003 RepID=A0A1X0P134_9TRYP|nr:uncharacterized protein TM35_000084200 [Trypanosoma theileri]ORC90622.1 hypothetical protein TM35_000084200 [Trypanosoma theileri]